MSDTTLTPTTPEEYRQRFAITAQLESGIVVRLRRIDALAFLDGDGTNPLLAVVARHMSGDAPQDQESAGREVLRDPAAFSSLRKQLNQLAIKALIEPRLIQQGFDDGLDVDELDLNMKMEIFMVLLGGAGAVDAARRFPGGQAPNLESVPGRPEIRHQAVDAAGDS